jgi:hypothetical protein
MCKNGLESLQQSTNAGKTVVATQVERMKPQTRTEQ